MADTSEKKIFPIGYVARATGLSTHVIRAWENRYGVVRPQRTPKKRRLYSQEDVNYLCLLQSAVSAGHIISQLADLNREELHRLIKMTPVRRNGRISTHDTPSSRKIVAACLQAITALNAKELDRILGHASVNLPKMAFISRVISPVLDQVGQLWAGGSLRIIHEHMASDIIQGILWDMLKSAKTEPYAPRMIVATPAGQACYLGAIMAAVTAADAGWKPYCFGNSLPAEEIAAATASTNASAVALSITYQADDIIIEREFKRLQEALPEWVRLFVGGRASRAYQTLIETAGGQCFFNLEDFAATIGSIGARKPIDSKQPHRSSKKSEAASTD